MGGAEEAGASGWIAWAAGRVGNSVPPYALISAGGAETSVAGGEKVKEARRRLKNVGKDADGNLEAHTPARAAGRSNPSTPTRPPSAIRRPRPPARWSGVPRTARRCPPPTWRQS